MNVREDLQALNNSGSIQTIIVLAGSPVHTVVISSFDSSNNSITYYDPQNSCSGSCTPGDIIYMYRSTYFNHY